MAGAENHSDVDLVSAAIAGDRAAFETLLRRHYDRIHGLAWQLTGSRADADDIAQDVCCRWNEVLPSACRQPRWQPKSHTPVRPHGPRTRSSCTTRATSCSGRSADRCHGRSWRRCTSPAAVAHLHRPRRSGGSDGADGDPARGHRQIASRTLAYTGMDGGADDRARTARSR